MAGAIRTTSKIGSKPLAILTARAVANAANACHGVTHFGYATVTGQAEPALRHLQYITGITRPQALTHVSDALSLSAQRSQIPWTLDLSVITAAGVSIRNPRTGVS